MLIRLCSDGAVVHRTENSGEPRPMRAVFDRTYGHYRPIAPLNHALGDRSEQSPGQSLATMCAHHDDVGIERATTLQNRIGRTACGQNQVGLRKLREVL